MFSVDRQACGYMVGHSISAEIFLIIYMINFFLQADNFFRCKIMVSYDWISDKNHGWYKVSSVKI